MKKKTDNTEQSTANNAETAAAGPKPPPQGITATSRNPKTGELETGETKTGKEK